MKAELLQAAPHFLTLDTHLRPHPAEQLTQPRSRLVDTSLDPEQRPGIPFEKRHVGAVAADGHVHGERPPLRRRPQRLSDRRRLAVQARRNEKDYLAAQQIA